MVSVEIVERGVAVFEVQKEQGVVQSFGGVVKEQLLASFSPKPETDCN